MEKEPDTRPAPAESGTASPSKNPVKKSLQAVAAPALVLLAIFGFFLVSGLRLCPVQSGSMEPEIPTYSMCLISTRYDYDTLIRPHAGRASHHRHSARWHHNPR